MKEFIRTTYNSPEELLSLMNNIPGVIYRGLPDWSMVFAGEKVSDLTGYTYEEFISRSVCWRDLIHPEDLGEVTKIIRDAVKSRERSLRIEYRIVRRDKEVRWLADRREMIYNEGGRLTHVDGVLIDRTVVKNTEEALRESEEKYRGIVEQSVAGVYIIQDGLFCFVNDRFCEILGYSNDEIVGRLGPLDITHPEDRDMVKMNIEKGLKGETRIVGYELRVINKDGTELVIKLVGSRGIYMGKPAIMGTMMDITREKNLQKEFLHSQKMEALGRLTGGIAHDINNYLGAITSFSELVKLTYCGREEDGKGLEGKMDEVINISKRASKLIDQLLSFSSRRAHVPDEIVDVNDLIGALEEMFARLIGEDIELCIDLGEGLWKVRADPSQLEQVLINLLVNGRDAMPIGGKMNIRTANVQIGEEDESRAEAKAGSYVKIEVEDTGSGIPGEIRDKVFEPFFSTKNKKTGTGLGLSTVFGIVKDCGGCVCLDSEEERGTTFKIYLPSTDEESPAILKMDSPGRGDFKGSGRLLLVEDNEEVRMSTKALLEAMEYDVMAASCGQDALEIFNKEGNIALVITDVVMPKMNGRELITRLREIKPDLKALYVSGYADDVILRHGIRYRRVNFLQKPFSLMELGNKVREILT